MRVDDLDPVESSLLMGAGIARGRANSLTLVFATTVLSEDLPVSSLALALWAYDSAGDTDVSGGRRILALGVVGPLGVVECHAGSVATSVEAMPRPPDVIVLGAGCRIDVAPEASMAILRVASLADAVNALVRHRLPVKTGACGYRHPALV